MASDGRNLKKGELVEQLTRKLARLTKDELTAIADAVEHGTLDFAALAREASRATAAEDGPAFGFQRRLQRTWGRKSR